MKTMKLLKISAFAAALAASGASFGDGGDIYEILPCDQDGTVVDAYATKDNPITVAGDYVYFIVRLVQRTRNDANSIWTLEHVGATSEIVDDALFPPQIGIYISGEQTYADLYDVKVDSDYGLTDLVFRYQVKPGDFALPIVLATEDGPASDGDSALPYKLNLRGKWRITNANGDEFKPYFWTSAWSVTSSRALDFSLALCGFYYQTIDFDSAWEVAKGETDELWRSVHQGSTITVGSSPALDAVSAVEQSVTLHVWSDDESAVRIRGGHPVDIQTDNAGTKVRTQVADVTFSRGQITGSFTIEGVAEGGTANLVLSGWTNYNYSAGSATGVRLQDYVTVPVKCIEPLPASVVVEADDATITADGDYREYKTRLAVYLTQPSEVPVTVTVTPVFEDDATKSDWNNYVRFSATQQTVQTLPSGDAAPTVTIPANSTATQYLNVFALRSDSHTVGDGHQLQFKPSLSDADKAASGIENTSDGAVWISAAKPVITTPDSTSVYDVTSGEELEISVAVDDTYADVTDTDTGYLVQIKANSSSTWTTLPERFKASGEDGALVGLVSGGAPSLTYNGSGEYVSQLRVVSPVSGKTSEITSFTVRVAAARTTSVEYLDDNGGSYTEGEGEEGDNSTVNFRISLSAANDATDSVYAFLLCESDADLSMFGGGNSSCIVTNRAAAQPGSIGLKIVTGGTYQTGSFYVMDGSRSGTSYSFSVLLCTSRSYNPANLLAGYPTTDMMNFKVYNREPAIDTVYVNGFESQYNDYTFANQYPKGQAISIQPEISDTAYDLEHGFRYRWSATCDGQQITGASGIVGHDGAANVTQTVADGTSINDAPFTYGFPKAGSWAITIQALDKDMSSQWSKAPSYTFNLRIIDSPRLSVEEATFDETDTRARLAVGIGYYDATEPMVVKLTVTEPAGDNPGRFTLSSDYKKIPDGYAAIVGTLADNEYLVSFEDANPQDLVVEDLDGTRLSSSKGFTVKAEVITQSESIEAGTSWADYYRPYTAKVYVNNVAPVLGTITVASTNAWKVAGGPATTYPIRWEIRSDVNGDFQDLWADGSGPGVKITFTGCNNADSEYITSASYGTFIPDFGSEQGVKTVVMTIEDKDGGSQTFEYQYEIQSSKFLNTLATGPSGGTSTSALSQKYVNRASVLGGLGEGHVFVSGGQFSGASDFNLIWNCGRGATARVYGWGYKVGDVDDGTLNQISAAYDRDVPLTANGANDTAGNTALASYYEYGDDERDSYLYAWLLNTVGESGGMTSALLGSLAPERAEAASAAAGIVPLPTEALGDDGEDGFAETYAEAIFSKEFRPLDNCGDINQDGIPDRSVAAYGLGVYDVDAGTLTGNDLADVSAYNDDDDWLPATSTAGLAIIPNASNSWPTVGQPFNAYLEIRGFGVGLNAGYPNADGSDPAPDYSPNEQRAWLFHAGIEAEDALKNMSDEDVEALFEANIDDATADLALANRTKNVQGWSPERPTDPTVSDTDSDGLPDGYEYWFWYGAKVGYYSKDPKDGGKWTGLMHGRRFNIADIEAFDDIPPEDIIAAFDPQVSAVSGGNAATRGNLSDRDLDNDGLYDVEEFLIGTNPVDCDTDDDGLPDGWEVMWGLNPLSPNGRDFAKTVDNPDGDYMAATASLTYDPFFQSWVPGATIATFKKDGTNYVYLAAVFEPTSTEKFKACLLGASEEDLAIGDCVRTLGGETIPKSIEACATVDPTGAEDFAVQSNYPLTLIHDQVRMFFGYDPRTAWGMNVNGYVADRWDRTRNPNEKRLFDFPLAGYAVNTRPYSTHQEFLYGKYRGMVEKNTVLATLKASCTNPNAAFDATTYGDLTTEFSSAQHGADTDGNGVPDGWEIYVGFDPIMNPDGTDNTKGSDIDEDGLSLAGEYSSTDGCGIYVGICDSIAANVTTNGWLNKFFPTDPNDPDTDGDGITDGDEGISWRSSFYAGNREWLNAAFTFFYGDPVDDGSSICFRGGGMNPCTADTDFDGIPDAWERQFAGIVVTPEGKVEDTENNDDEMYTKELKVADGFFQEGFAPTGNYIMGGMDATDGGDAYTNPLLGDAAKAEGAKDKITGTVRDRDFDHDGLENFQEYLVQSVRAWRFDDAETPLMGRAVIWTGDPATTRLTDPVDHAYVPFDVMNGSRFASFLQVAPLFGFGDLWGAMTTDENLNAAGLKENGFDFVKLGYFAAPDHEWDPMAMTGRKFMRRPSALLAYMSFENALTGETSTYAARTQSDYYFTTDPRRWDSDGDGMDDFWEIFHGLDPILGESDVIGDAFAAKLVTLNADNNVWCGLPEGSPFSAEPFESIDDPGLDAIRAPWRMGLPDADPDGDGLRNFDESIIANSTSPSQYHTDPSPLWMTDATSPLSYTYQYYRMAGVGDDGDLLALPWAWSADLKLGTVHGADDRFRFSFERTEGYDTDGDFRGDGHELVKSVMNSSDPLDDNDPDRRAALYLSGENSLASSYVDGNIPGTFGTDIFKQFTVEMWVKPERTGVEQTIFERGFAYPASNLQNDEERWRANFRVALDPEGVVYGMFDNDNAVETGTDEGRSCQTVRGWKLATNEWSHVALSFDGSILSIYIDGDLKSSAKTGLIPANGVALIIQDPGTTNYYPVSAYKAYTGAHTVGARRTALELDLDGGFDQYTDFYKGYVSEIRLWDGARPAAQIKANYKKRMTKAEIIANREAVFEAAEYTDATRNDNDGKENLIPRICAVWNFSQLPSAVNAADVAKTPAGFQSVLDNCKVGGKSGTTPDEAVVGWWNATPLHSTVYSDYHVVPRAMNIVATIPLFDGSFQDSVFWSESYAGYTPASFYEMLTYAIPNGGAPYKNRSYKAEPDYHYWRLLRAAEALDDSDALLLARKYKFDMANQFLLDDALVPLGDAYAKRDADFWDGQGASSLWTDTSADSDGDGLPDWWEAYAAANYGVSGDVTPSTVLTYRGKSMTAAEAYVRDLAHGMQPDASTDAAYVNREDKNFDGVPDWWADVYGLTTRGDEDEDYDGLSNYTEYLLSEVFDLGALFSPVDAHSISRYDTDYFFKIGKLYAGEIFTDHDMMEDWWEKDRGVDYASRYAWDALSDKDEDRWSAFAECRYNHFSAAILPENATHLIGENEVKDFPIPTINLTLRYNQSQRIQPTKAIDEMDASGSSSSGATSADNGDDTDDNHIVNTLYPLVIQTYTAKGPQQELDVVPDAYYTVFPGDTEDRTFYLGAWGEYTVRGTMSPGYVEPADIYIEARDVSEGATYTWTCKLCPSTGPGSYADFLAHQSLHGDQNVTLDQTISVGWQNVNLVDPTLFVTDIDAYSTVAKIYIRGVESGWFDTQTGEFEFDIDRLGKQMFKVENLDGSYRLDAVETLRHRVFRICYKTHVPELQYNKLMLYLGEANTGAVREGRNRIVAFYDMNVDGMYTPGEPLGVIDDVEVSWHRGFAEMELTDTSPVITRATLVSSTDSNSSSSSSDDSTSEPSDRHLLYGTEAGDVTDLVVGSLSGGKYERFRVVRTLVTFAGEEDDGPGWGVDQVGVPNRVLVDKWLELDQRNFFFEGDVLENGELDLDWSYLYDEVINNNNIRAMNADPVAVTYRIVLGNGDVAADATNNLYSIATVRRFDYANNRTVPTPVAPGSQSAAVFGARPTFKWTMNGVNSYTAFRVQILPATGSTVVWDSGLRRAPATDMDNNYAFVPDAYAGDQLEPTANYRWRVSMYNAKFKSDSWSATSQFRMNTLTNGYDYGSIKVCAKYFGPSEVLNNGTVYVEAYNTPDFAGSPVSRAKVSSKSSVSAVDKKHSANAILIGLPKGKYYVRAFIDHGSAYGTDRVRDDWESWGYVCPRNGESKYMFTPTAIVIGEDVGEGETYTCYIEDSDTNGNCLPDAWEMVSNRGVLDDGTENIDDTLASGVAINKALTDNLQNLQGEGTAAAGLAAYTFSVVKNAGVAALMLESDTSSASTYTASIKAQGSSTSVKAEDVKFTLISAGDGSLSVAATGDAALTAKSSSGVKRLSVASSIYSVSTAKTTLTGKLYTSTDLKNWTVATEAPNKGVITVTVTDGSFDTGEIDLSAYAGEEKRFFKIIMD